MSTESNQNRVEAAAAADSMAHAVRMILAATQIMSRILPSGHDLFHALHDASRTAAVAEAKLGIVLKRIP